MIDPFNRADVVGTAERPGVILTRELRRIIALPRRRLDLTTTPDLTPLFRHTARCTTVPCDICDDGKQDAALRPLQSAALIEAESRRGLLGPMPVGSGKTLVLFLLVNALKAQRAAILVPPHTYVQVLEEDIPRYSRHFTLPLDRARVISYSQLSSQSQADALEKYQPDAIICDEAHALRRANTARTKRFTRYMKDHPGTAFVALSGTLASSSVRDFAHLSEYALRMGSPIPNRWGDLEEWSAALDPDVEDPMPPGALLELARCNVCGRSATQALTNEERGTEAARLFCAVCDELPRAINTSLQASGLGEVSQASIKLTAPRVLARLGVRDRLLDTEGVIGTSDSGCGASIIISGRSPKIPAVVEKALKELKKTWVLGDEELEDATAFWRAMRQVSLGFYYRWAWPSGTVDREWLEARRNWHRATREFLTYGSKPGLDSAGLVENAVRRGELPRLEPVWCEWAAVMDRPEPPTVPVWLDSFALDSACAWAHESPTNTGAKTSLGGVIWFEHIAFGEALAKHPKRTFPVFFAGQNREVLDFAKARNAREQVCALSLAHAEGKNLQIWSRCLVTSPPAGGKKWEQMVGRFHRPNQRADEVLVGMFSHTDALRSALFHARDQARSVPEQMLGTRQKLCSARIALD